MRDGTLTAEEVAQLELPWSPDMVEGFRLMVGGTIQAARIACGLRRRTSQVAVPSLQTRPSSRVSHRRRTAPRVSESRRRLLSVQRRRRRGPRAAGARASSAPPSSTSTCTTATAPRSSSSRDPRVFTFSMHQQHNYPMWKPRGSLDIGLPDGVGRRDVISRELEQALPAVMASRPAVRVLSGRRRSVRGRSARRPAADARGPAPARSDGDRARARAPASRSSSTLAGGYARHVEDTVAIHVATIEEAVKASAARDGSHDTKARATIASCLQSGFVASSQQRQPVRRLEIDDLAAARPSPSPPRS